MSWIVICWKCGHFALKHFDWKSGFGTKHRLLNRYEVKLVDHNAIWLSPFTPKFSEQHSTIVDMHCFSRQYNNKSVTNVAYEEPKHVSIEPPVGVRSTRITPLSIYWSVSNLTQRNAGRWPLLECFASNRQLIGSSWPSLASTSGKWQNVYRKA